MDSPGVVTAWEPPHRFAYEERDWQPGAPPLATEFLIEARSGGLSVVRLVSSLFTSSAAWDDQSGVAVGERRAAAAGAPALAGIVERAAAGELVLRTTEPAPGVAVLGVYTSSDRVQMSLRLYLFGDQAPAVVARDEPAWRAWMAAHFPAVEANSETGAMA